jgi:glycosyltransferase involved in cell wall biosynthesis
MKVLVVNNAAPFIRGGAEELADHLVRQLNATNGVQAELLRVPFAWEPRERLVDEIVLNQAFHLYNVDRVIGLKFPAYLIPHPQKVLWILHQFRQAYDLDIAGQSHLGEDETGVQIKRAIRRADDACFAGAHKIWCNSPVTQARMKTFNGFDSEVLYPPLNDADLFGCDGYGDYIFAGGRVAPGKRQHLLVEAMAHTRGDFRLVIAGPPESAAYAAELEALVERLDLKGRVSLAFGYHPREDIARWVNQSLACAYLPFDEDSVGYVTMEAFAAAKPVLTVTDSGGVLELVGSETGVVVQPDAQAIAQGLEALAAPGIARRLGPVAKRVLDDKGLSWAATLQKLLA